MTDIEKKFLEASEKGWTTKIGDIIKIDGINVNIQDDNGNTPLILNAQHGHIASIKLLVKYTDIDINIKNKQGKTAVMIAQELGYKNIVALIESKT